MITGRMILGILRLIVFATALLTLVLAVVTHGSAWVFVLIILDTVLSSFTFLLSLFVDESKFNQVSGGVMVLGCVLAVLILFG